MTRVIIGIIFLVYGLTWACRQHREFRRHGGWELRSFWYAWIGFGVYLIGFIPVLVWTHHHYNQNYWRDVSEFDWQLYAVPFGWMLIAPAIGITWLVLANRKHRAEILTPTAPDVALTAQEGGELEAWASRNFS